MLGAPRRRGCRETVPQDRHANLRYLLSVPVGVRFRLFKWAVIGFLIVFAVGGALVGPAIVTDLTSRTGTFATTARKLERLRNILYWRSPEQKRLLKAYDGPPKPAAPPRTYYVTRP